MLKGHLVQLRLIEYGVYGIPCNKLRSVTKFRFDSLVGKT